MEKNKKNSFQKNSEQVGEFNKWYSSFDPAEEVIVNSDEDKETAKIRMKTKLLAELGKTKSAGLRILYFKNNYWKAAASIAFIIIISSLLYNSTNLFRFPNGEIKMLQKQTNMGEKSEIILSDGSKITLNAGSKIKYPDKFTEGKVREIYLEGEAFFEIVHSETEPFLVHSGKLITKDIGTQFNIKAYDNENNISVSLIEGKVEISSIGSDVRKGIKTQYLNLSQQLIYRKENESFLLQSFDRMETIGWINNILIFRKEKLSQVAARLERNYGVKFELPIGEIGEKELTANFQNESFFTAADAIKKVTGLEYKTVEENNRVARIIFY